MQANLFLKTWGCLLVCLAVATAQFSWAPIANGAETTEQPAWFKKAMAREKKVRRKAKLEFPGGVFNGRVPGKILSKPEKSDGSWYFSSKLGTDSPLECAFYEDPLNVAYATGAVAENVLGAVAESLGKLQSKTLVAAETSHAVGRPITALEWLYTISTAEGVQAGLAKVRGALIGEAALICWHNELGYRSTFERAFESLVSSAKVPVEEAPYYEALYLQSLSDRPIGFVKTTLVLDADGDTRSVVVDASLLPVDDKTLSTSDSSIVSFSNPDGTLINAIASGDENGETSGNLRLDKAEGNGWRVSGEFQNKALDVVIESDKVILSELGQVLAVAELQRTANENKATITAWLPDVDPASLLPVEVVLDKEDRTAGQMAVGGIDMKVRLDRSGNMIEGSGKVGQLRVTIERVWERGQIPAQK